MEAGGFTVGVPFCRGELGGCRRVSGQEGQKKQPLGWEHRERLGQLEPLGLWTLGGTHVLS